MTTETGATPGRLRAFWIRHRTLFWTLHSLWALATGVFVMFLARERYGFVPWVVFFLALTWLSTLLFGRRVVPDESASDPVAPSAREEAASYVTRTLYQETLFFLLPFYAYSTVLGSANVTMLVLLGALAVLSCLDLVFDRLLRTRPAFAVVFFATVAFAAINLVLPMLLSMEPRLATGIASIVALASSLPFALGAGRSRRSQWIGVGVGAALLTAPLVFPGVVPAVPLRLDEVTFSQQLDRTSLEPSRILNDGGTVDPGVDDLFVLLEIFAPGAVPSAIVLEWRRDGSVVRTSRDIEITAHEAGFRVWDAWSSESGDVPPGLWEVRVRTAEGKVFGTTQLRLTG